MKKAITFCGEGHYTLFSYPLHKEVKRKMPKKQTPLKPGQITPTSGQYGVVGPRGGKPKTEVTAVEGKRLPPTPKPGQGYVLVDETQHKDK